MPTLTCLRRGVRLASLAVAASTCVTGAAVAAAPDGVPFAAGSPFNQLVPANPQIAGNSGNIDRALGLSNEFYTPAVYVSRPSDPLITIRLSWTPNPLDGVKVRVDPRAVPSSESDAHVTIVDTERDLVISLYQAKPISGGVLQATSGGMASLSGNGANRADSSGGRESGISQLAGLITPDDVRRAVAKGEDGDLGHALAFVHHSVTGKKDGDMEGIPNAIMEAMAMELPVLSTLHSGIPELVENGLHGFLVEERAVAPYAHSMQKVLSWSQKPENREKVRKGFEKKNHARQLTEYYREALEITRRGE